MYQLVCVAAVKSDARLVQYVETAHKAASERSCQIDALALAAGKGACGTGQREIIQTHALQKLQAVPDLLHDLPADKRIAETVQREISQTYIQQEADAVVDFYEDAACHVGVVLVQFQVIEKGF